MNYYLIVPNSDVYDSLKILIENSLDIYHSLNKHEPIENWSPLPVSLTKTKQSGDFPSMSGLITFTEKAWQILKTIIISNVELLPLQCKEENLYAINILEKASLDLEIAEVDRSPSGRIIEIDKYAFKKTTVIGKHIFVPEEKPYSRPIVSETFKETVEKNGLKGLIFKKVWEINENE